MKVLMLGWELPPHNSGGLGVACLNMARALARKGTKIDFVLPYLAKHPEADFMEVLAASDLDPLFRYGGGAYDSTNLLKEIIPTKDEAHNLSIRDVQKDYCHFVEEYLEQPEHQPDVVHAHDWLTFEAGMLAKKEQHLPLVAHVHATEFDRAGNQNGNPLIHQIEYEGLKAADKVIAVSNATKRIIREKYHVPAAKIDVIYNSLDENYYNSDYFFNEKAYQYALKLKWEGYTIIATVGRFTVQKGLIYLLRAARLAISKNPKLLFIFAGDGEEKNELIMKAAEFGIFKNVIFTGFVRGRKLRDIYALADVFVMSSVSEPFGLTALEAAHHGDALILTKQSGVSEIVWSALKYDFWDVSKLADEIVAISLSHGLTRTLKENVTREYRQISWEEVAKKCLAVYNESIKHEDF